MSLAPKQGRRSLGAKARIRTARWSVAGLDAGPLPGTVRFPMSFTQRSALAATPALLTTPKPVAAATAAVATAATSTTAEVLTQHVSQPESVIMLPIVPAVAKVAVSETPVHRGLSSVMPALRVGTARCTRRCGGIGKGAKASRPDRNRSARRAVGAWLQPKHMAQQVPQAAFDPSRVRMQLQLGLQISTQGNRSRQPRSFTLLSAFSRSVYHARSLPFSINRNQCQRQ
jgi:hypothetical protein